MPSNTSRLQGSALQGWDPLFPSYSRGAALLLRAAAAGGQHCRALRAAPARARPGLCPGLGAAPPPLRRRAAMPPVLGLSLLAC